MGIDDGNEEAAKDFEVTRSSSEDRTNRVERSMEDRVGQLDRSNTQVEAKAQDGCF